MVSPRLTVVFDSSCGVCQASVRWLSRRDAHAVFQFVGNDAPTLPVGVSLEEAQDTVVVLDGAHKWTQAAAVARVLRELPAWAPVGLLLSLPGVRAVAKAGYGAFSKRRHRVSALLGLDACAVPRKASKP